MVPSTFEEGLSEECKHSKKGALALMRRSFQEFKTECDNPATCAKGTERLSCTTSKCTRFHAP